MAKRNTQDATLINVTAAKKREMRINKRLDKLERDMRIVKAAQRKR